jgi:hypothetical protein
MCYLEKVKKTKKVKTSGNPYIMPYVRISFYTKIVALYMAIHTPLYMYRTLHIRTKRVLRTKRGLYGCRGMFNPPPSNS